MLTPMSRSFKRASRVAMLAASLCCCRRIEQSAVEPVAIAELSFDDQAGNTFTSTVSFVSDGLIAIGRHPSQTGHLSGTLTTIQWKGGKLGVLKTRSIAKYRAFSGGLFPAGDGNFISS